MGGGQASDGQKGWATAWKGSSLGGVDGQKRIFGGEQNTHFSLTMIFDFVMLTTGEPPQIAKEAELYES